MAGWLIGQLRPHGRKGIRLSSARELLTRVDRKLAAVLGAHLPDKVADWDDAIQSIVQATGERHRNNIAIALQQLDTHVRAHKRWDGAAPDLDDGVGSIVDAQLITESEFQSVLQALHLSAQPRRCLVAAILGYRCGLRRTEIRGLRWIDVQLHPQPLLFVRSHAGRALKRDSGRRVLLLTAFCPQAELNLLRQIHAETGRLLQNNPTYTQTAFSCPIRRRRTNPSQKMPCSTRCRRRCARSAGSRRCDSTTCAIVRPTLYSPSSWTVSPQERPPCSA